MKNCFNKLFRNTRQSYLLLICIIVGLSANAQSPIPNRHWTHTAQASAGDDTPTSGVDDWYYNIMQSDDGGYLAVGFTKVLGETMPIAVKMNSHGGVVWEKTYTDGQTTGGPLFDATETDDGYYLVGGRTDFSGDPAIFVVKVSKQDGSVSGGFPKYIGTGLFGANTGAGGSGIEAIPDGSGGYTGLIISGDRINLTTNERESTLVELDLSGNVVQTNSYLLSGHTESTFRNLTLIMDAGGNHVGYAAVGNIFGGINNDVYVVKADLNLNTAGAGFWQQKYSEQSLTIAGLYSDDLSGDTPACIPTNCPPPAENGEERGFDIEQIPYIGNADDGNIMVSAQFDWYGCFNPSGCSVIHHSYIDIDAALIHLNNATGSAIWGENVTHFAGIDYYTPIEIQTCGSNYEVLLVGNNVNGGEVKNHLIKTKPIIASNSGSSIIWEKFFTDGTEGNCVFGLDIANDGGYIVAGNNEFELSPGVEDEDYFAIKVYSDRQTTALVNAGGNDITSPLDITGTVNWNGLLGSRTVYDKVTVKNGGNLIIDGNAVIRFADSRQLNDFEDLAGNGPGLKVPTIEVEPGGQLTVDNATLTGANICGQDFMWQGIQVLGNPSLSHTATNQGWVTLRDATIKDAFMGVLANGSNFNAEGHPTTDALPQGGGIVKAVNTTFENCRRSVHFSNYPFSENALGSNSYLKECTFITNAPMADPDYVVVDGTNNDGLRTGNNVFVSSWNTHNIKIEGNSFSNNIAGLPEGFEGDGVVTADARIYIRRTCGILYPGSPGCAGTPNSFNNLSYGVRCTGGNALNSPYIDGNNFNNCNQGVYIVGLDAAKINRNTFDIGRGFDFSYGAYLYNCSGYQIEENTFTSSYPDNTGLWVFNNDVNNNANTNEIYNNDYSDLLGANIGLAQNRGDIQSKGLDFLCNNYVNNEFDEYVALNPGISEWQGSFSPTEITAPAGNTFDGCPTPFSSDGELANFAMDYTYWHHGDPITIPNSGCYTLGQVIPSQGCLGTDPECLTFNENTACPSSFTFNIISVLKSQKASSEGQIVVLQNALDNLIDGGDTQGTLDDIDDLTYGDLKNELLTLSPYLSDEVLKAYILSGAPEGHIQQVILANSPVTDAILEVLNTAGLSPGIMNLIDNAQVGVSEREKKEAELGYYQTERELAVNGLIREYLHNDSLAGHLDSVAVILKTENRRTAKCQLVDLYRQQDKFNEANSLLDSLALVDSIGSLTEFCDLQRLLIQLEQAGETCFKMKDDTHTRDGFEDIAEEDGRRGCSQAQALIDLVFETGIPEVFVAIGGTSRIGDMENDEEDESKDHYARIYPNPATGEFTLEYRLPDDSEKGIFMMYDITGKKVVERQVTGSDGRIIIPVNDCSSGLYLYAIQVDGKPISDGKIVINQ